MSNIVINGFVTGMKS